MNDREQLRQLGEVKPKPADPLTGWAIRVVNGEVTGVYDEAEVRIYKDGTLAIIGYPSEEPPVAVDVIEALIALWREVQS